MTSCPNCGTQLGCSCQLRTASDGKKVCSTCITAYENKLKITQSNAQPPSS